MGERALLVQVGDPSMVLSLYAELDREPLPRQSDAIPGADSLLVVFGEPVSTADRRNLRERLDSCRASRRMRQRSDRAGDRSAPGDRPPGAEHAGIDRIDRIGEMLIEVVYDGPDLDDVGRITGLGREGVIAAHTGVSWRVAFCGFAPGFGYLAGGDPRLAVPRRSSPRPEVPAGTVGLAGEYSGVYPRRSPGGWQAIGRTEADLWDPDRHPPALLRPGMAVRFRAVRSHMTMSAPAAVSDEPRPGSGMHEAPPRRQAPATPPNPSGTAGASGLVVVRPGPQCTVQDLGRNGFAALGVSPSGAADRAALRAANDLVGNPPDAAGIEILLGGAEFRAVGDLVVALTGAPVDVRIEDSVPGHHDATGGGASSTDDIPAAADLGMGRALPLPAGARFWVGRAPRGLRVYLAVRGGIDTPGELGSRSTDTLSGLGPAALRAGQVLPIGPSPQRPCMHPRDGDRVIPGGWQDSDPAPTQRTHSPTRSGPSVSGRTDAATVHQESGPADRSRAGETGGERVGPTDLWMLAGPQTTWLTPAARGQIAGGTWSVDPASDRVGVRLADVRPGAAGLERARTGEVPSQGLVRGAIQLTPSGQLIAFLADFPVTGGYPVIAVLIEESTDALAQLRPGSAVRLNWADDASAATV